MPSRVTQTLKPGKKTALDLRKELLAHIKGAELSADGSAEEAWLAFSTLHVGLAGLLLKESSHQSLANQFEGLVYIAIKTLPAKLEQADEDGLSPLALLACCAPPLAMLQNDQDLLENTGKRSAHTKAINTTPSAKPCASSL